MQLFFFCNTNNSLYLVSVIKHSNKKKINNKKKLIKLKQQGKVFRNLKKKGRLIFPLVGCNISPISADKLKVIYCSGTEEVLKTKKIKDEVFTVNLPLSGVLACLDGYMNIALEQTEEYANGQVS